MALNSIVYNCNYTSNVNTKKKKWYSGLLKAVCNHGSISLSLYELNEYSNSFGRLVDTLDIFKSDLDSLPGREFITPRNIIDVIDVFQKNEFMLTNFIPPKPVIRTGLQKFSAPRPFMNIRTSDSNSHKNNTPNFSTPIDNRINTIKCDDDSISNTGFNSPYDIKANMNERMLVKKNIENLKFDHTSPITSNSLVVEDILKNVDLNLKQI
ncbi:hypothetical protein TpMuguga_02g02065 [Theileria parva strain Muguga]|uniref:uncharacterized protein n=1 Tax=Theileria parva strain Muguga TaxID=333668 RepID=UPI001C617861|nr:uncharacterized protein TpMuguga_02g02065 [Theileria parva strain Muguga]KAF5153609.1 hypothetical protein TpMuguga_02g02065 [Theileria parva strain Muguga]